MGAVGICLLNLRREGIGKGMSETWVEVTTRDGEGTGEEKEGDWHPLQRRS